ncbi:MAG: hypothetical protein KGR98_00500 [Verrucomicrobia bacterium]|nr:hypothetical protein [Verrucomicrobiota bacterium]MDE3099579.1 hypothetical protein [Verrucomicrobiota bacterium]
MSLFVECKPDETLAFALGVPRNDIEHANDIGRVCKQLSKRENTIGMVDEDPGSAKPPYFNSFKEQSREHGIRVLLDSQKNNRMIVLSPRLEEWLVQTTKSAGLRMTEHGFNGENGSRLHAEINHRLGSLQRLVEGLLAAQSPRLLRLKLLLTKR